MKHLRRKQTPEEIQRILDFVGDFEITVDEKTGIRCITGTSNHTATVIYHTWSPFVGQIEHARVFVQRARQHGDEPTVEAIDQKFSLVAKFMSRSETEAYVLGREQHVKEGEVAASVLAGLTNMTKEAVRVAGRNSKRAITSLSDFRIKKTNRRRAQ